MLFLRHTCGSEFVTPGHLYPNIVANGMEAYCVQNVDRYIRHPECKGIWLSFAFGQSTLQYSIGIDAEANPVMVSPLTASRYPLDLEEWVRAWKPRCAELRALGKIAVCYTSPPRRVGFFYPFDTDLAPIVEAGFTHVGMDTATYCSQLGRMDDTMKGARRALKLGLKVIIEPDVPVRPHYFPWYTGAFEVASMDTLLPGDSRAEVITRTPGWFGPSCTGTASKRYVILNGAIKPPSLRTDRVAYWEARGFEVVMEPYGVYP